MLKDKDEINVIYLSDGETWDRLKDCTVVFGAVYDESENRPVITKSSWAIKLWMLIPFGIYKIVRNPHLELPKPTAPHKS